MKNCPFCGGFAKLEEMWVGDMFQIKCVKCDASISPIEATIYKPFEQVKKELIEKWNTRYEE